MTFSDTIQQECKGLTPWEVGRHRENMLAGGLRELAMLHGIRFREPLYIDGNGEFSLVCCSDIVGKAPCYGQPFVALLNKHNPRTGIYPTKYMDPRNNWCRINHFDVECMLNEGLA